MSNQYRHFTDAELCRYTLSRNSSPLERELAERLEKLLYTLDEEEELNEALIIKNAQLDFWL